MLSKIFTGLAIGLSPLFKSKLSQIKSKLFLTYLLTMTAIVGVAGACVYEIMAFHLRQQFEKSAIKLASNAAAMLELIKHEHEEYFTENDLYLKLSDLLREDLGKKDKIIQNLYGEGISVEWWNEKQQVLVKEGEVKDEWRLAYENKITKHYDYKRRLFSLILPVKRDSNSEIIGYIKVTESTINLDENLFWLKWGVVTGGLFSLSLIIIGSSFLSQQSIQPILASFQELKQFTADISHELRNPLTVIQSTAQILLENADELKPANQQKIKIIASAAKEMKCLTEDLLLLVRIDKEILDAEKQFRLLPIDEICEDLVEMFTPLAESKQITLQYHTQLQSQPQVWGNASNLQRLVGNILSNAIEYNYPGGEVKLTVKQKSTWVIVEVEDTGIGIPETELKYLFQRFWRGEKAKQFRQQGSGLGLAIAHKIVKQHGGRILVTSQVGKGSIFSIHLPLASR